jgi:hypothetical protein
MVAVASSAAALVLRVIHLLCRLLQAVCNFFDCLTRRLTWAPKAATAIHRFGSLLKVPRTLCFAFCEERLSYADISHVVMWSVAAGVRNVYLWDPKGRCACDWVCESE